MLKWYDCLFFVEGAIVRSVGYRRHGSHTALNRFEQLVNRTPALDKFATVLWCSLYTVAGRHFKMDISCTRDACSLGFTGSSTRASALGKRMLSLERSPRVKASISRQKNQTRGSEDQRRLFFPDLLADVGYR